ncbi:MAG: type I-C CRISPR-associated protein Cas7/Csd2 [Acidaminococcaceae bacterium]
MSNFTNKIDFAMVFSVKKANPNGDPLNGNRPRENYAGYGEVSDVCLKRKIRNRLQDMEYDIFVQSEDKNKDGYKSLSERASSTSELKAAGKDKDKYAKEACAKWIDVRSFGQVFAFKSASKGDGVSVGVRGPVSIQSAVSLDVIDITSMQITKSVNSEPKDGKSSDTMGMKHSVDKGVYVTYGSINHQLAEKTGFSAEDAEAIKQALISLFENDCSAARPDGSMEVLKVVWWKHNCFAGQYSSAKVHRSLTIDKDSYKISVEPLADLAVDIYDGV